MQDVARTDLTQHFQAFVLLCCYNEGNTGRFDHLFSFLNTYIIFFKKKHFIFAIVIRDRLSVYLF